VIVIDDGSSDDTGERARNAGAIVIRHDVARGKGVALQAGWHRAQECGFQWALALDGDGQHSAEDIPSFLSAAERTGAELVIGNRMSHCEGMPWLRRQVNRWMSKRISGLTGLRLPDSQCGFRLMNLEACSKVSISAARFEIESDVLLAFASQGYSIEFVPIQVIYKSEKTKIHPFRDTVRWFRWWRLARRRMLELCAVKPLPEPILALHRKEESQA
jgi:glycosyltransferase involved in cell wall biosynthesis